MPSAGWRKVYRDLPFRSFLSIYGLMFLGFVLFLEVSGLLEDDYEQVKGGLVFLAVGALPFLAFRPSIVVTCTPDYLGIRHGTWFQTFHRKNYPWRDILRADFKETVSRGARGSYTAYHLDLAFRDGYQVEVSRWTANFHDMMRTVGEMTPHLRYIWLRRDTTEIDPVQTVDGYVLVERSAWREAAAS